MERSGGVVWLRKLETAIQAVQRGTDRTASELALARLGRELDECQKAKAGLLEAAHAEKARAEENRARQALASFVIAFITIPLFFAIVIGKNFKDWYWLIWIVAIIGIPSVVYQSTTMSLTDIRQPLADIDAHMAQLQEQIDHHRAIVDAPTA